VELILPDNSHLFVQRGERSPAIVYLTAELGEGELLYSVNGLDHFSVPHTGRQALGRVVSSTKHWLEFTHPTIGTVVRLERSQNLITLSQEFGPDRVFDKWPSPAGSAIEVWSFPELPARQPYICLADAQLLYYVSRAPDSPNPATYKLFVGQLPTLVEVPDIEIRRNPSNGILQIHMRGLDLWIPRGCDITNGDPAMVGETPWRLSTWSGAASTRTTPSSPSPSPPRGQTEAPERRRHAPRAFSSPPPLFLETEGRAEGA